MAGSSVRLADTEQMDQTPGSRISSATAPNSNTTIDTLFDYQGIKESMAIREDFRQSLAKLTQVQSLHAQENNEHSLRADLIMRDIDEMRSGLKKYKLKDVRVKRV